MNWTTLSIADTLELADVRNQLHQAVQIVAAIGRTFHPKSKMDEFASFTWNSRLDLLQGTFINGEQEVAACLSLRYLKVCLINRLNEVLEELDLDGKTMKQVLVWFEEQLVRMGFESKHLSLNAPYEIPPYPQGKGSAFMLTNQFHFSELSCYYSNSNSVLQSLRRHYENISEVKCWPHHFDIASLITVHDTGDSETSSSIGIGFSPGDEQYEEPYFYITPWPYPPTDKLPHLSEPAIWHTENWVGGVLKSEHLVLDNSGRTQDHLLLNFYKEGVNGLLPLMN